MSNTKNKPVKIVIGETTFRSTYADSNALWRVIEKKSKDCFLCEIVNEVFELEEKPITAIMPVFRRLFSSLKFSRLLAGRNFGTMFMPIMKIFTTI